ncbi:MAG: ABC transporter ATP-binding protein [Firmicutes bacterium]|nr:ABC transporter ATP-binding protein [Bacillota bacterium]
METPVLEVKHLKKYFKTPAGQLHAVDDVNFTIEKGHTLGVVGESGCGKTTLGRTILRLLEPTSGEIYFNGEDITKAKKDRMKAIRRQMQLIFQDPYASLNPRMSVAEIIKEPMIVNKMYPTKAELDKRVQELMEVVGLAPRLMNTYPHEMDGGRRQRVGIARALATNPEFIVCDEPVSALDVSIQAQILNLMMDLQEEKQLSYLFITHDLSVVKHISTEIAVMYLGQCVEKAPTAELFENPLHPYTKALLSAIPAIDITQRGKEMELLTGEVHSPVNPVNYCRFHSRCKFACEACKEHEYELKEVSPGHFCACPMCGSLE